MYSVQLFDQTIKKDKIQTDTSLLDVQTPEMPDILLVCVSFCVFL